MIWTRIFLGFAVDSAIVGVAIYLFLVFHNEYPRLSCAGAGVFAALALRALRGEL